MMMKGLRTVFDTLWKGFIKDKSEMTKNKILSVLKELLRRGGMTDGKYSILVNELDQL